MDDDVKIDTTWGIIDSGRYPHRPRPFLLGLARDDD